MRELERSCGNRITDMGNLLCCDTSISDKFQLFHSARSNIPQTMQTPSVKIEKKFRSSFSVKSCLDLNGNAGTCKNIRECPSLLSDLLRNRRNRTQIQFFRQSNAICGSVEQDVCCPIGLISNENQSNMARTMTKPDLKCGISDVTRLKSLYPTNLKPRAEPWLAILGYSTESGALNWHCMGSLITAR